MWSPRVFAGTAIWSLLLASSAVAQSVAGGLSISAGSATDVAGVTSRAVTVSPSLTYAPDARALFGLDLTGTRYVLGQWSAGTDATAALRAPIGDHLALTFNGGANATSTSYEFSYRSLTAVPALEATAGPIGFFAGAVGSVATISTVRASQTAANGLFGGPPIVSNSAVSDSRHAAGALFGLSARFDAGDGTAVTTRLRETHETVAALPLVDRVASLELHHGSTTISGALGVRAAAGGSTTFGNGVLAFDVGRNTALQIGAGAYPADPLIGTPAGHFFTLGLSLRTGRASPASTPSVPGLRPPIPGMTRLAIRADDARRVEVAGDFNHWTPVATVRASNGVWFVDLPIPPGQYRYAFRVDGKSWTVPAGAPVVDDDFGGKAAWLIVAAPSTTAR